MWHPRQRGWPPASTGTCKNGPGMAEGNLTAIPSEALRRLAGGNRASADVDSMSVGLGERVLVVANLCLPEEATPDSTAASRELARVVRSWNGPGVVIVAGGLLEARACQDLASALGALSSHQELASALADFGQAPGRRLVVLVREDEVGLLAGKAAHEAMARIGAHVARALDLDMETSTGHRLVRVVPEADGTVADGTVADGTVADTTAVNRTVTDGTVARGAVSLPLGTSRLAQGSSVAGARAPFQDDWLAGMSRLADPSALQRFVTSRLFYRRMARYGWWLLLPVTVAIALRIPFAITAVDHLLASHPAPRRLVYKAHSAPWGERLAVAGAATLAEILVLAGAVALIARKSWSTLTSGLLELRGEPAGSGPGSRPASTLQASGLHSHGATANDPARDSAVALVASGYAGLVSGATLQSELTHLGSSATDGHVSVGFFAATGAMGEVVEEVPSRAGLPPVFAIRQQVSWVELETGAELHVRLVLARNEEAKPRALERLAARREVLHDNYPTVVASHPGGPSWPPPPDLASLKRRSRRVRRISAALIALAGVADLLDALTPPLRSHLHLVEQVMPLAATQAAGALVALAGLALLAIARGVRRGQRQAWAIAVGLLASTLVLHAAHGGDLAGSLVSLGGLVLLLLFRDEFSARQDAPSLRAAAIALFGGTLGATVIATAIVELSDHIHRGHATASVGLVTAIEAVLGRLVGFDAVSLPDRLNDFLSPSLLAVGFALAFTALLLATRPVVDRRRGFSSSAEARARDIVRRHGAGTLDYFALRSDKRWFFHRDSLVAYAIYGGVCLVSPDPIGPESERAHAWSAFRRFADGNGWAVAVMGASAEWLPLYRASGMHDIYIGDEAVVDVRRFSLAGGHMKGLRQAYNRIARYGYTVSFHDPARVDPALKEELRELMRASRRGEAERGFSMMLGRIFDPRDEGLLLTVVRAPDGMPVAMCQFVPAPGIEGYSLDLMRRHLGDHPNGLIDFALVSTIEHLRERGLRGLSLNFAAMRSLLDGERGDGPAQKVERWAIRKLSGFLQIESLWRFNAKYEPDWLSRYIVYDAAEHFVPVVLAILRAESLSELPVIGKLLSPPRQGDSEEGPSYESGRSARVGAV
jgi:lysylphosphatidylglycerol synthetase-like protein (DUF2156 family)